MNLSDVEAAALKLPDGERARLVESLLESLGQPVAAFRCEVGASGLEAFVACVALGTLEAMRTGTWSLEAGIWTLARPVFWQALEGAGLRADLLDVLQRADELDAIGLLGGRSAAEAKLDRMIDAVRACLPVAASAPWFARWLGPVVPRAEG